MIHPFAPAAPAPSSLEDQDPAPVGLLELSYSPGGGSDEAGQTPTYTITDLPNTSIGQIGSLSADANGESVFSAITETGEVTMQLQQMVWSSNKCIRTGVLLLTVSDGAETIKETVNINILPTTLPSFRLMPSPPPTAEKTLLTTSLLPTY